MPWYNTAYHFKKQIVIDHTKVSGGANLSNFPVLISRTDADLKSSANGGNVQNSSGFDIIFTDSTEATQLDHEIEQYVSTTGEIEMWVRIPTLSASADTVIYLYYDNSSISTSQENKTGVWDANYKGVWHLKESGNGTAGEFKDSTSNANHGQGGTSATCPDQVAGQIGKGQSFVRANLDTIVIPNAASLNFTTTFTLSAWFKSNSTNAGTGNPVYLSKGSWEYSIGNTGAIELDTWENNATNQTGGTLSTSWVYVVWTLDSAGNHSIGYVNGSQVFSAAAVAVTTSANTINMGHPSAFASTPNTLDGILDEVRASNVARSAGWVTTEYNNQSAPATFYSVGSPLSQGIALVVTLAGVGSLAGTLGESTSLTSTINAVGTLTGSLVASLPLSGGNLSGIGVLTGVISAAAALSGSLSGLGALSGTLSTTGNANLTATLAGTGVLSGVPGIKTSLSAGLAGVGTLNGTLGARTSLSISLVGIGTLNGTLSSTTNANLSAIFAAVGTFSGTASLSTALTSSFPGVGVLSGTSGLSTVLTGALSGAGALSVLLQARVTLSASSFGLGTLTATPSLSTALFVSLPGVGALSGLSTLRALLSVLLPGSGSITGLLQGGVTLLIRSITHATLQVLSTAWNSLPVLGLSSVLATALTITHQGIPMPAPNTTILSTITVTDISGALVSNANSVSLVVYFPDGTTSNLALNSGILNLGSGQYQAKYNTKQPGEIRELWSIVGADGTTLASAQFLIGVEY